jgi:hypothetical protein
MIETITKGEIFPPSDEVLRKAHVKDREARALGQEPQDLSTLEE